MTHFGDRLAEAVERTGSCLAVGIDPRIEDLPHSLACRIADLHLHCAPAGAGAAGESGRPGQADPTAHGAGRVGRRHAQPYENDDDDAGEEEGDEGAGWEPQESISAMGAIAQFVMGLVRAAAGRAPVVKLNAAFFERWGAPGVELMGQALGYARHLGLLSILDAKRGDVPSTAELYAQAYLDSRPGGGPGALEADAITVNPYLGDDAMAPFLARAGRGKGVFVLVRTSNAGASDWQDRVVDGHPLWEHFAARVAQWSGAGQGARGLGAVGGVVGATRPDLLQRARALMPGAWLLVPGIGAQGGRVEDLPPIWTADGLGVLVAASRSILAGVRENPADDWEDLVRESITRLGQSTARKRSSGGAPATHACGTELGV